MEGWRFIDSGRGDAAYNMSLDEALARTVREGGAPPTLRLYEWDGPSVTLGCFQKAADIDIGHCISANIPVVRRPTGGRALLHDRELTYSFSAGTEKEPFSRGLLDSYRRLSSAFCLALRRMGVPAEAKSEREKGRALAKSPLCFETTSYGEITVKGKKVIGSAQKRWVNGLLQQGSIPYAFDEDALISLFGSGRALLWRDRMAGLGEILPELDVDLFKKAIVHSFEETFGVRLVPAGPSREEEGLAQELAGQKFRVPEWNLSR